MHKKYQDHIPCGFSYELVSVYNKFSNSIILYRGENAAYKFIEEILEEYEYCEKVMKKHFKKNLILNYGWKRKKKFDQIRHTGYVENSLKMKK